MTEREDIERMLRGHYADKAQVPSPISARRLDQVVDQVGRTRQQVGWLARVGGHGFGQRTVIGGRSIPGNGWILVLLAVVLSLIAGVLVVSGGRPDLGLIVVPSSSASPSPSSPELSSSPGSPPPPSPAASDAAGPNPDATDAGLTSSPPAPSGTGTVGQLAFIRTLPGAGYPGQSDLFLAEGDGANPHRLVSGIDGGGEWSANGRYLTVDSETVDGMTTIQVIKPNGTIVGRIDAGESAWYRWSPVADEIAVESQTKPGPVLRIFRADGTLVRRLKLPAAVTRLVNGLDWSPDGQRLVIGGCIGCKGTKYDDTPDLTWDLWIVAADGGRPIRLTDSPQPIEADPTWSPDGSVIAYWAVGLCLPHCPPNDIWTIRPDGSQPTKVIPAASGPVWSPDGTRMLYSPDADPAGASGVWVADAVDVWVADADGSHRRALTTRSGQDSPRAWSQDGSRILFVRVEPGDPNTSRPTSMWSMNADGTDAVKVASDSASAGWRPAP